MDPKFLSHSSDIDSLEFQSTFTASGTSRFTRGQNRAVHRVGRPCRVCNSNKKTPYITHHHAFHTIPSDPRDQIIKDVHGCRNKVWMDRKRFSVAKLGNTPLTGEDVNKSIRTQSKRARRR